MPHHNWTSPDDVGPVDQRPIDIEARTVRSLMSEFGIDRIDLLKLDVEGAEWEVLPELVAIETLDAVIGELHWDVAGVRERPLAEPLPAFDIRVRAAPGRRAACSALRPRWRGGGGIRTRGPLARTLVFKTSAFDRSATPPGQQTVAPRGGSVSGACVRMRT